MKHSQRLFYGYKKWKRNHTLTSLLLLILCMLIAAPLALQAATPGLPFVEDFSHDNLKDPAKSNVKWSPAEQKVYLAWRNKVGNIISPEPIVQDVGGVHDQTCTVALGDINGDGRLDLVTGNNAQMNKLYLNTGTDTPFNQDTVITITADFDKTRSLVIGDVDGDGDLDVVAGNNGQINKLYLNDGEGDPFDTATGIAIGVDADNTYAIVLGDLDGDGDLDVVVGNSGQTNKLYINDGEGNPFDTCIGMEIGTDADDTRALALGDLNNDGKLDLVVGNSGQINKLYLNDGEGDPFDTIVGTEIGMNTDGTHQTRTIALGDLNGDGLLDVMTGYVYWDDNIIFLNDGEGDPFDTVTGQELRGASTKVESLALADIDGDGNLDWVDGCWDDELEICFGDGRGGIATSFIIGTVDDTESIAVGDVNGDGTLDVVTGNFYGQMNRLYLNNGRREKPVITEATGTLIGIDTDTTYAVAVGDLDGDGDLDVVTGNSNQTNKLYLNDGQGDPFDTVTGIPIGTDTDDTRSIAVSDMNGDGMLDVVTGNYNQTNKLYLNDGQGDPFDTAAGIPIGTDTDDTRSIAVSDLDGDGDLDVVAGNYNQTNKLYLNDGQGDPFAAIDGKPVGTDTDRTLSIALGDLDGDGNIDVVAGNDRQNNRFYLNDGDDDPFNTQTTGAAFGTITDNVSTIALGDLDGDGKLDVLVGDPIKYEIRMYLNDGDGNPFDTEATVMSSATGKTIAVGDLDEDGDVDIVSGGGSSWADIRLFLNDGDGNPFDTATSIPMSTAGGGLMSVALDDMDGDGDLDIVTGGYQTNRLYLNNPGENRFRSVTGTPISTDTDSTRTIALADLNGDGKLDVIVGNFDQRNKFYLNSGSIDLFDNAADTEIGGLHTDVITAADMDGDGDIDIIGEVNYQYKLYLNDGEGNFTPTDLSIDFRWYDTMAVGDVNGDGKLDVVVGNDYLANVLYLNDGEGDPFDTVTAMPIGTDIYGASSIALGDMDGDGDLDVVFGNTSIITKLYLNDGDDNPFDSLTTGIPIGTRVPGESIMTTAIAIGDVDGDGDLDVVTGNSAQAVGGTTLVGAPNKLYLNDGGDEPFSSLTPGIPIGTDLDSDITRSVALGDVDGDGNLDLVVGNDGQSNKLYLNGHVKLPFATAGIPIPFGLDLDSTYAIALGDVDGNGDLDIVTGNNDETNKIYFQGGYNTASGLATSREIDTEAENNISNATLTADDICPVNTRITYFLSNNGGARFYRVRSGVEFIFPTVGHDLHWRAELASLAPIITPRITEIRITNRNMQPVVAGGQTAISYLEDDPPVVIDETITVTDIDNVNLTSASIKIVDGYHLGEDLLNCTTAAGITGTWNQAAGELLLTGEAPVAEYEAALRSATYVNLDQGNPTQGARTIVFSVNDGSNESPAVTSTVNLTSTNDPPIIVGHDPDPAIINQGNSIELSMNNDPAPAGEIHLAVADPDNNPEDLFLIIQSGDNYFLQGNILTPIENFSGNLAVPLIVYDGDDYGAEYILNIQVNDVTDPTVSLVAVQVGGLTIDISFSEPMGSGVATPANYIISGSGRGTLSQNPDSVENLYLNTYQLTWNTGEMRANGDVTVTVSGVEDASGRVIGTSNSGTDPGGGIGIPPATTASPPGGHHNNIQQVTLNCLDAGSGCAGIHYTTDGTEPTLSSPLYTGVIPIDTYTELRFFSVDQAGNREGNQTEVYHIDIPTTISCTLNAENILLGEAIKVSGQITPAPAGPAPGLGIRLYPPGVIDPAAAIQIPVESHTGGSFEKWINCEFLEVAGLWKVETTWTGDDSHLGADSVQENLTVDLAESSLVLDVIMGEAIKINNKPPIGGKFTALPFCEGGDLSGIPITLQITEPGTSGVVHTLQASTNLNGQFVMDYETNGFAFDRLGEWTIQAIFAGSSDYASASSALIQVRVVPTAGYAVIIQGKSETGEGLPSHLKTTNFVYDTLIGRQLLPDDIEYFSWDVQSPRWDNLPFKAAIQTAITQTMKDKMIADAGDLYIIMVDHGWTSATNPDEGEFYIHPDDPITSTELGQWLDDLQNSLVGTAAEDRKIVLILGFCRAGAYINALSGANRVVIASAAADEYSHRGPRDVTFAEGEEATPLRDGEYFVTEFFKAVSYGKPVTTGFTTATSLTETYTATGSGPVNSLYLDDSAQHPLFDDNEDGVGSNEISAQGGGDGSQSQYLYIGTSPPTGNDPGDVLVTRATEARFLGETDNSVDLWARVDFPERLKLIWAEIKAPGYEPGDPGAGYQIEMETYRQATSLYEDGQYEWLNVNGGTENPDLFSLPGTYQVFYFAKDLQTGHVSPLKESKIYKARPAVWGPYTEANHAPDNFNLLSPDNGETVQTNMALNWEDSADADGDPVTYTVLLSKDDASFTDPIRKEELPYSSCLLTAMDGLEDLTIYYWKVEAIDQYGAVTESSEIRNFYTDNENGPEISIVYAFVLDELGNVLSSAVVDPGSTQANSTGMATLILTSGIHTITANVQGFQPESQTVECMGGEYHLHFMFPAMATVEGDTDGDADVDGADLVNLSAEIDLCTDDCSSDFDGDGDVDQNDLDTFSAAFGL